MAIDRQESRLTVPDRVRLMLELVAERSTLGKVLRLDLNELAPLFDVPDDEQLVFLLRHLHDIGYIAFSRDQT